MKFLQTVASAGLIGDRLVSEGRYKALPSDVPQQASRKLIVPRLYVETAPDSGLFVVEPTIRVTGWTWGIDGEDCKANLAASLSTEDLQEAGVIQTGDKHLAYLMDTLTHDRRIRIGVPQGMDPTAWLFEGRVETTSIRWSDQQVTATAIHEAQWHLRNSLASQIIGRWMPRDAQLGNDNLDERAAQPALVRALPCMFNAKGKPNRAARMVKHPSAPLTEPLFLFTSDDAPNAQPFSYADALRYVAGIYINPAGVVDVADFLKDIADAAYDDSLRPLPPNQKHTDPFVRGLLEHAQESTTSVHCEEALKLLCKRAGLHFTYETISDNVDDPAGGITQDFRHRLLLWAAVENSQQHNACQERARSGKSRMGVPLAMDIPRDAPFSDYSNETIADALQMNAAQHAHLTLEHRNATILHLLGGPEWFEVTVLLRPGWLPHPYLDNIETQDDLDAAIEFWEEQFGEDKTRLEEEIGTAYSLYHSRHKEHGADDPLTRVGNFASRYCDVGRLWVFPDSSEYLNASGEGSPYARTKGPWKNWQLYSPWIEPERSRLAWSFPGHPSGVVYGITEWWAARRRPFEPLLSFDGTSIDNRAPIVRVNFVATDANSALADDNWITVPGEAWQIDKARAAIQLRVEDLIWNTSSWLDPMASTKEKRENAMLYALLGQPFQTGQPIRSHFFVSITAAIRGDDRTRRYLDVLGNVTFDAARVIDTGLDRYLNYFKTGSADIGTRQRIDRYDGKPEGDGDPGGPLYRKAHEYLEYLKRKPVAGSIEYPWLNTDVRPGDSFSGCHKLGIEFTTWPQIVTVEYVVDEHAGVRTVCHLSDLRHAPEVGAE